MKKRIINFISICLILSFLLPIVSIKAEASNYPVLVFCSDDSFSDRITNATATLGSVYKIRMRWIAEYQNEGYDMKVYDPEGDLAFTGEETWRNKHYITDFTIPWDTKNCVAGKYTIEVTRRFYTYLSWHEAPQKDYLYVTLIDSKKMPNQIKNVKIKNSSKGTIQVAYKNDKKSKKYQIQYSTDKDFKSDVKKKITTNTTITIKKLKKGKTYYVRVCGINGKAQGAWSSVKKIKIKK